MPEIKKQFTGGKMNKDFDERLVPNGEYRDAMNIQVSTSEGSDVGTVQNILGNSLVLGQEDLPTDCFCVGSVSDEKNDTLYWLLTNNVQSIITTTQNFSNSTQTTVSGGSFIVKHRLGVVTPVFVDVDYVAFKTVEILGYDTISRTIEFVDTQNLFVGMEMSMFNGSTHSFQGTQITIKSINGNTVEFWEPLTSFDVFAAIEAPNNVLLFQSPGSTPVLGFDKNHLITSINIVDNFLIWTDNNTEPKKINIDRSIAGTPNFYTHTSLIVNDLNLGPIEESHITVIKKGPTSAPRLTKLTSSDKPDGKATIDFSSNIPIQGGGYELLVDGDALEFSVLEINTPLSFEVGDILLLNPFSQNSSQDEYDARVIITSIVNTVGGVDLVTEIATISDNTTGGPYRVMYEETGNNLFKLKFPRFALRYKYEDSEYSPVGPFSNVAFVPGTFDYHPTKAYNIGMTNELRQLTIENYVKSDIPKDVTQVDILYKNDTAPNIYVVKSVYKNEEKDSATGNNTWDNNSYEISTENIYAQLPGNQLLRPWDNVPTTALAQEVVGNRVVYGNYHQNYDMVNSQGESITPSFETYLTSYPDALDGGFVGRKSIKSLRTYDFGIVYSDKHGRETPVFADSNAAQTIPKILSENSNRFSLSIKDNHPEWADSYKVFIKETSNEYYNLALDRVYDAEDGNVWLSFPSVDRNKVDEETYLILKKEAETSNAVKDDARYKVVAIDNEAPDYIKTKWELLGEPTIPEVRGAVIYGVQQAPATASTVINFEGLAPYPGHSRFTITKPGWNTPYDPTTFSFGLLDLKKAWDDIGEDEIYVFFTENEYIVDNISGQETKIKRKSEKYLVTNIEVSKYTHVNTSKEFYEVSIAKPISGDDAWITAIIDSDISGATTNRDRSKPHFYKKIIENSPEFDGRFFVKIIEDSVISELRPTLTSLDNYSVIKSIDMYDINDTDSDRNILDASGSILPGVSKTYEEWKSIQKFGGTKRESNWFIDAATYAGAHPYNNMTSYANYGSSTTSAMIDLGSGPVFVSDWTTNILYYTPYNLGGGSQTALGTGRSIGNAINKGVHRGTYSVMPSHTTAGIFTAGTAATDSYFLSLSYSGLDTAATTWKSALSGNPELKEIHKLIKVNQRFRIRGDDTVYIIKGVTRRWLYNYRGGVNAPHPIAGQVPVGGNPDPDLDQLIQEARFQSKWNKRANYLIQYEILGGTVGLEVNQGLNNVDATFNADLEFLQEFFEEGPQKISENPAVFETEPKEDPDLEIYYEATNAVPLSLTYFNQEDFAPIGTFLELSSNLNISLFVAAWGDANSGAEPNILFLNVDLTDLQLNYIKSSPKPHIGFSKPDGSTAYANVIDGYDDYSVTTAATLTSGGVSYVAWRGVEIKILPNEIGLGWHNCWSFNNGVESNRIGDTYNKPYLSNGAKASTTLLEPYAREHRKNGLIYSGIYNSNSNTNNLNQFIAAEKITKDINPTYGSIQKLHTRDSNLVVLCEDKILKVTANKDALYNADGNPQLIATDRVLGQTIPFVGEYGISQNPESFASESYRAYFTDKSRGAVIRLSMDGITPISEAGMSDWFKDNLRAPHETLIGSYDDKKDEYNITFSNDTIETTGGHGLASVQLNQSAVERGAGAPSGGELGGSSEVIKIKGPITVSYKESVRGWVSFKSFVPENAISCNNEYYTFQDGRLYLHHDESQDRNTFYEDDLVPSKLSVVLNDMPGVVKSFNTLNYEGSKAKVTQDLEDDQYFNLNASEGWFVDYAFTNKEEGSVSEFIEKEGKWFNYIKGIPALVSNASDLAGFNVQGIGVSGDGCVDPNAVNYNSEATVDDGTCSYTPFLAAAMVITSVPGSNGIVTLLVIDRIGDGIHPTDPGLDIKSLAPQYYGATYPWLTSTTITWVSDGVEDLSLAGGKYGSIYANTPWSITITSGALQIIFSGVGYDTTQKTTILQRS